MLFQHDDEHEVYASEDPCARPHRVLPQAARILHDTSP